MQNEDDAVRSLESDASLANHLAVAETLWRADAEEAAVRVLQRALRIFGEEREALVLLSMILSDDDPRSALECLRRAERAWCADADVLERIGRLLGGEPETKAEAEVYFARVIAREPTNMYSRLYLANLVWERGDKAEAERLFREAVANDDGSELAIAALADYLAHEDRFDESASIYASLTERDPLYMYWEARMLNWSGRSEEAMGLLRASLEIDPSMERARLLLLGLERDSEGE